MEHNTHTVPSGLKLEVLSQKAASTANEKKNSSPSPIVFVHGSYHAAWCWREHFFQYFTDRGHDVYAVSMRRRRPLTPRREPGRLHSHSSVRFKGASHRVRCPTDRTV